MTYLSRIKNELEQAIDGSEDYDPSDVVEECVERLLADRKFIAEYAREALPGVVRTCLNIDLGHARGSIFKASHESLRGQSVADLIGRAGSRWDDWFESVNGRRICLKAMTKSDLDAAIERRSNRFNREGQVIAFLLTLSRNINGSETVADAYTEADLEAIVEAARKTKPTLGSVRSARKAAAAV